MTQYLTESVMKPSVRAFVDFMFFSDDNGFHDIVFPRDHYLRTIYSTHRFFRPSLKKKEKEKETPEPENAHEEGENKEEEEEEGGKNKAEEEKEKENTVRLHDEL
jgi:hypothetical protein